MYAPQPLISARRLLPAARRTSVIVAVLALAVALPATAQSHSAYNAELKCAPGDASFTIDLPLFGTRRYSQFWVRFDRTGVWYQTQLFYTAPYVQMQRDKNTGTWSSLNWGVPGSPIYYVIGGNHVVEAVEDRWSFGSDGSLSYARVNLVSCTTSRSYFDPIPITFTYP